jgi:PqqD family protein of HPr-rel-A system
MTGEVSLSWKSTKLVWKSWDREVLVYNTASGNTHLLSPNAAEVLELLEKASLTPREVAQQLTISANVSVDEEITQRVEDLLLNLNELGLVELAA